MDISLDTNCWIFPETADDAVNIYADFLHSFSCVRKSGKVELIVSADTDFKVWANGQSVGEGQYPNYPDQKTYERFDITEVLRNDQNHLAFTVFYNGRSSSVYRRGEPGLFYRVVQGNNIIAESGTETRTRINPAYHSGPIAIVSHQLTYTFGYDTREDDAFYQDAYTPSSEWRTIRPEEATLPPERATLSPRPIPRLVDNGATPVSIHSAGLFSRNQQQIKKHFEAKVKTESAAGITLEDGKTVSPGWLMQHDTLSTKALNDLTGLQPSTFLHDQDNGVCVSVDSLGSHDGTYLVLDMQQQEAGYLEVDMEAPEGTFIDIGYGEHLDDQRVRSFVGGRSFASRLIAKDGRFFFRHEFLRWAGRYLSIHVASSKFTLYRLQLRRRDYPTRNVGEFESRNPLVQDILKTSRRTLSLCMHEHYEDTPWREQALYANDARTQALCGYYAFGETAFPHSSFSLLGQGLREDGFLALTAPAKTGLTIPSFTLVWMLAVRDHFLYSGDPSLAKSFLPQIKSMLRTFLSRTEDGLTTLYHANDVWHFYDWSGGMSSYSKEQFQDGLKYDAPLNCFLILALEATQEIDKWLGNEPDVEFVESITTLRKAVVDHFWNPQKSLFRTIETSDSYTELTQALAVLAKVGEPSMRSQVLERMSQPDSGLAAPGLSQSLYTFSALFREKEKYGKQAFEKIESTWSVMLKAGATSFWETIKGASDFSNAGSLCHAWSASPLFFYFRDLLGVKPLEPGFKTFSVEPTLGYIDACEGVVPVPSGTISVSWQQKGENILCKIDAPTDCIQVSR